MSIIVGWFAHPAAAQGIFGRRLQEQQKADREQAYAGCNKLLRLVEGPFPFPAGTDPNGQITRDQYDTAVAALIADDRFVPVFGKPFDELADDERKALHELEMTCRNSDQIIALEGHKRGAIMRITQFPVDRSLLAKRNASNIFEQLAQNLATLPATPEGYAALRQIEAANRNAAAAAPTISRNYSQSLAQNRTRILLIVDRQRAETVLTSASGWDGMMQASRLLQEFRTSPVPDPAVGQLWSEYVPRLDRKIVELLPAVQKQAKADYLEGLGKFTGLDALAAAKEAEAAERQKWSHFSSLTAAPDFAEFRANYRSDLIQKNQRLLVTKIETAQGGPALSEIADSYLCECDRGTPAMQPVLNALAVRRKIVAPFDDFAGGDYLNAIYSGDQSEVSRADASYFAAYGDALDKIKAMVKKLGGGNIPGREALDGSLAPRVLTMYLLNYESAYAKCLRPDAQTFTVVTTRENVITGQFGAEIARLYMGKTVDHYRVNMEFVAAFTALGASTPDDLAGYDLLLNNGRTLRLLSGVSDAMAHFDCADPRIKRLEKNMLKFYDEAQ